MIPASSKVTLARGDMLLPGAGEREGCVGLSQ